MQKPAETTPARQGDLRLDVRVAPRKFVVGEPIRLFALFRNVGREPVVIIKAVDGSISGIRNPSYSVRAAPLSDASPASPSLREWKSCGNINPIFRGDVVEIQPGKTADPFEPLDEYHFQIGHIRVDPLFTRPGRYAVWVEYTNASPLETIRECVYERVGVQMSRQGKDLEQLRALHVPIPARAPLVVAGLHSNRVEVEIVDRPEAAGIVLSPPPDKAPFEPGKIVAEVRDGFGRPLQKSWVSGPGFFADLGDGRFSLSNVVPGRYELTARDASGALVGQQTVEIVSGASLKLQFQREASGSMRLTVRNLANDGPVPFVALLAGQVPLPASFDAIRGQKLSIRPRPGPRSEPMVFPELPVGKYTLFIGLDVNLNRTEVFRQEVEIRLNQDQLLEVVLPDELLVVPSRKER